MTTPDLTWMVEACGDDHKRMAELSIVLAMAALAQTLTPDKEHAADWILHYRTLIRELERRVKL